MIVQLFNASSVSGPERLVLPAIARFRDPFVVVNLREERLERLRQQDPLENYARSLNLPFHAVRVRSRWDRIAIRDLHALLEHLHPALVHVHSVKGATYLSQACPRGKRTFPIVATHHGVHGLPDLKTRFFEWLHRRFFLTSFDRVLAVSTADYEFLLNSGMDQTRLRLHLNGGDGHLVAPEQRANESTAIRRRWLPGDKDPQRLFLMAVVGRLSAEKDHERVLRVLASLQRLSYALDWRCLFFGSGVRENALRNQAAQLGLSNRIIWMGYQPNVSQELSGLDLLLSFSKAEGLPMNLVEAGWAGTPVLSTCVGGVHDLIPNEQFGNLVEPDEPDDVVARRIHGLMTPEGLQKRQAQATRFQERVTADFTQAKWLQRLEEIYSELGVGWTRPS